MASDLIAILVRLSVVGCAAALLVGVLRSPTRRTVGAEAAYWLWLLVPASLIAVLLPRAPSCLCGPESLVSPLVIRSIGAPLEFAPQVEVSHYAWDLMLVWGFGAAAALAYFVRCQQLLRRSLGLLQPRPDGNYSSERAGQPMLVGAWRPRIVLPVDFESRYSGVERAVIVAHERAHVERHDALTNGLALGLVCLFWFNPVAYWAWSRFRFDQEVACDAAVLRATRVSRRRYARALARTQLTTWMAVAFGWRRRHPLVERVAMLRRRTPSRAQRIAGYAFALMLMLSGTYVVWAAQPEEASAPAGWPMTVTKDRILGPQLHMLLAPRVPVYFQADSAYVAGHASWRLEGHVRITAGVIRIVHAGPDVITRGVRPVIAMAERAVVTPQQRGGFDVTLENGSVEFPSD